MPSTAVSVDNLSKRYRIGLKDEASDSLVGAVLHWANRPLRNLRRLRRLSRFASEDGSSQDVVWALKDVCFEVKEGQAFGIIGPNGAGKSTLLKVLSRITEPTSGRATIRGRVSSLLEVGTGFHPELTGRENIYLNGTVLGMSRREIGRKFDEIVDFSGVETFIDTPVKRYSSGMQVRLAFSVAAHLEPEVLIVDEVLAVGDAVFQKKCLGRMESLAGEGRTVLFVSHNMVAINSLTQRCILLDGGRIHAEGATSSVVQQYLEQSLWANSDGLVSLAERTDRRGDGRLCLVDVWLQDPVGNRLTRPRSGDPVTFVLEYTCDRNATFTGLITPRITLHDSLGQSVLTLATNWMGCQLPVHAEGGRWACTIDSLPLMPDRYSVEVHLGAFRQVFDHLLGASSFEVVEGDFFGSGEAPRNKQKYGPFLIRHHWDDAN